MQNVFIIQDNTTKEILGVFTTRDQVAASISVTHSAMDPFDAEPLIRNLDIIEMPVWNSTQHL